MRALLFVAFATVVRADEAPPAPPAHHRKTPPTISHDCLLAAGPRQNHSMFKSKDFGDIISSWGVIESAPPAPFNMDAPQGAGSGEYYMCQEFDDYSFYSVSVGVPSSGGGGRRRRGATSREAYMKRMTETLSSLAQHPADIASKRRRLYGGYGGGNSVGMCLPSVCSAEDVKIITGACWPTSPPTYCSLYPKPWRCAGYYWFWLNCGSIVEEASGGGGGGPGFRRLQHHGPPGPPHGGGGGPTPEQLIEQLNQCGQTHCPMPGPPPPPRPYVNRTCEYALYKACESKKQQKIECELCTSTNKAALTKDGCTAANLKDFCNPPAPPPPPPFNVANCYFEACPSRSYDDEDYDQGTEGARRRLYGGYGGGGSCPDKKEPVPLDGWGWGTVAFIIVTIHVITCASLPWPWVPTAAKAKPKPAAAAGNLQGGSVPELRSGGGTSESGVRLRSFSGDGSGTLQSPLLPDPPPARPPVPPGGASGKKLLEIAHCWNFQRNYQALFKPDPGIKGMSILNGMRVLAIMCVVMGHTWVRSNPAASPSSASQQRPGLSAIERCRRAQAFMRETVTNEEYGQKIAARKSSIGIIGNDNVMDNGTGISYMSVDTFFFFSGFLAFYSMLTSVVAFPSKAKAYEPRSLLQSACVSAKYTYAVVLHRYMRLTPMYFFILMIYMYVWPAFGDGPNWKGSVDMSFCHKYWWTNILYISNLYPCQLWNPTDGTHGGPETTESYGGETYKSCGMTEHVPIGGNWKGDTPGDHHLENGDGNLGCMIQTWYLSNDFQMFVAAIPCALLFKWKIWAAYAYNSALLIASLWWGWVAFDDHLGTMCDIMICGRSYGHGRRLMDDDSLVTANATEALADPHRQLQGYGGGPDFCDSPQRMNVIEYYYDKPWARFPPYGVGMLLALLLMHLRREPDADPKAPLERHPNGIPNVSNNTARPRKMPYYTLLLGWAAALASLYYIAFGPAGAVLTPEEQKDHTCKWGGSFKNAQTDNENDYGSRTHGFWDLFFTTFFRCWWAVAIAFMVWASMAEQGGPIGAFRACPACSQLDASSLFADPRRLLLPTQWAPRSGSPSRTSPSACTSATSWSSTSSTTPWVRPTPLRRNDTL